ncbi:hypothetical protein MMC12_000845 [Toensbergia leucococca]|nr:hypothetical protein [Toensbergia leucococca]
MALLLPNELLLSLSESILCREFQIRQLATLLDPNWPNPSILVLYGLEATGKSLVTNAIIRSFKTPFAIQKSQECITARHLLERALAAVEATLSTENDNETKKKIDGRCESISAFVVHLRLLLEGRRKFILVFDGIDRQREIFPTLLPAIARLGEIIQNLTIVLIITAPRPRLLHRTGVPHIHFPPYDRTEILAIVSHSPLQISETSLNSTVSKSSNHGPSETDEDSAWLWSRFCGAVWDSLGKGTARDLLSFRTVCERLWKPFIQPVLDGTYGTRDFSKLMVRNRGIFQGEAALMESLVAPTEATPKPIKHTHSLPFYTKHLLLAAYLASHSPQRQDLLLFTKAGSKPHRRKRPRNTPSSHRKIQRKLLGPQAFVLERLFAIFHAIVPRPVVAGSADLQTQVATLVSLRLLVRTAAGGADVLDAQTRWKVNVGWEYVRLVARSVRFDVEGYLAE